MIEKLNFPPYGTQDEWINKINELVDAVNGILDYAPLEMAIKAEPKTRSENVQPDAESRSENVLTKSLRMDKEFAEDECVRLQAELERIRKALDRAKWWLHEIVESHRYTPISTAEMALKEITALEQKD